MKDAIPFQLITISQFRNEIHYTTILFIFEKEIVIHVNKFQKHKQSAKYPLFYFQPVQQIIENLKSIESQSRFF